MKKFKRIIPYFFLVIFIVSCNNRKYIIPKNSLGNYEGKLYFATYDESKYPRDTINLGPNDSLSLFTNKWYSEHLNSMKEPIIYDKITENLKIIRFTNLGTWENPFVHRVEKLNNKTRSAL